MRSNLNNKNILSFFYNKETNTFTTDSKTVGWYGDTRDIMLHNNKTQVKKLFIYKGLIQGTEDYFWENEEGLKLIITK